MWVFLLWFFVGFFLNKQNTHPQQITNIFRELADEDTLSYVKNYLPDSVY